VTTYRNMKSFKSFPCSLVPVIVLFIFKFSSCASHTSVAKIQTAEFGIHQEWAGMTDEDIEYKQSMDRSWDKLLSTKAQIQSHLSQNQIEFLPRTVVYPFSGIDVLNLFSFFPSADNYILFGLEDPGYPSNYSNLTEREKQTFRRGILSLSEHLAGRNYFTYRKMKEETKKRELNGAYPVFVAFLTRMGKTIIDSNEETIKGPDITYKGFQLHLYDPKLKRTQKLTYFKIFLTGKEGVAGDGITEYFGSLGPKAVFTKSAEYLFHGERRSLFRDLILKDTDLVVQDESGFPIRFFPKETWARKILGRYEKSWNLSGAVTPEAQKELKELSDETNNAPLPFPFGYGVLGTKDNKQSAVLIFQKK